MPSFIECKSCIQEKVKAGENPEQLVVLPARMKSGEDKRLRVCPHCDGEELVKLATRPTST